MHLPGLCLLFAAGVAGKPCQGRLKEMETRLTVARAKVTGPVYHAPDLEGFEPAIAAGGLPLVSRGMVVQIGLGRAWLNGKPIPGSNARERLSWLSAELARNWDIYRMLQPDEPPNRMHYVIFDRRVTVRDAIEVVAAIGREDRIVPMVLVQPLAKRRLWWGAFEPFLRATLPEPKVLTTMPETQLVTAFRSCPITRKPPVPDLSEEEYRALAHQQTLAELRACDCADADLGHIEEFLLWNAGVPEPSMRRLAVELVASGGESLVADGDAPVIQTLVKATARTAKAPKRVTIQTKAAR
jgi:hypothetical protein